MESHINKKQRSCCRAETWAFVIGWLQTIYSAFRLYLICTRDSFFLEEGKKQIQAFSHSKGRSLTTKEEEAVIIGTGIFLVVIPGLALLIEMAAGIYLINCLKQQNVTKLFIWTWVEMLVIAFAVIGGVVSLLGEEYNGLIRNILKILFFVFGIWIVKLQTLELLDRHGNADPEAQDNFEGSKTTSFDPNSIGIHTAAL